MRVVYWVRGVAHADLLELSIASVRRAYGSGVHVCVYTEEGDPARDRNLPAWRGVLPSGRPPMIANLDAQLAAAGPAPDGTPILFLDADTLVREPYELPAEYDLGPTWRDHVARQEETAIAGIAKVMPYNYGVLYGRAGPRLHEALLWLRARIWRMAEAHRQWYGNQFALAELAGHPSLGDAAVPICWSLEDEGMTLLRVRRLPCDTHNYTPERADEAVEGKVVLHFKGGRKDMMERYAT